MVGGGPPFLELQDRHWEAKSTLGGLCARRTPGSRWAQVRGKALQSQPTHGQYGFHGAFTPAHHSLTYWESSHP